MDDSDSHSILRAIGSAFASMSHVKFCLDSGVVVEPDSSTPPRDYGSIDAVSRGSCTLRKLLSFVVLRVEVSNPAASELVYTPSTPYFDSCFSLCGVQLWLMIRPAAFVVTTTLAHEPLVASHQSSRDLSAPRDQAAILDSSPKDEPHIRAQRRVHASLKHGVISLQYITVDSQVGLPVL